MDDDRDCPAVAHDRTQNLERALFGSNNRSRNTEKLGATSFPDGPAIAQRPAARVARRPQERWQIGDVIGMQMADRDQRQIRELRLRLRIAQMRAAAQIDQDLRLRADPEQIARRCAVAVHGRPLDPRPGRQQASPHSSARMRWRTRQGAAGGKNSRPDHDASPQDEKERRYSNRAPTATLPRATVRHRVARHRFSPSMAGCPRTMTPRCCR